jgi:hypothetical protein
MAGHIKQAECARGSCRLVPSVSGGGDVWKPARHSVSFEHPTLWPGGVDCTSGLSLEALLSSQMLTPVPALAPRVTNHVILITNNMILTQAVFGGMQWSFGASVKDKSASPEGRHPSEKGGASTVSCSSIHKIENRVNENNNNKKQQ